MTGEDISSALPSVDVTTHEALYALMHMASPQSRYRGMIESGGFIEPGAGMALSFSRETTDYVLRHHELFSSNIEMSLGNVRPLIPLNVDPPLHSSYRKLLDPLFAPKRMDEQEDDITRRVNALIDGFIDGGECNFTEKFAEVFPSSVFLGLMGLPEDEMRQAVMDRTGQEIYDYFGGLVDARRDHPADDVISRFLAAEIDGKRLTREDILDICYLFLIAGLDTVSDTLTCMYAFLATHPEHRQMIVDDPSCIPNAVEELLRWESPVPFGAARVATQDADLPNGRAVKQGTAVMVVYGAANVDERACPAPFDVRFDREENRHIAFGGGVHRCLGSHLARRELRITLREWHRRIPDYWLKPGHEALEYPPGLRHVKDLTLAWK